MPSAYRSDVVDEAFIASLYRAVFGTPEGQKVLDDIVQRLCCVDTKLVPGSPIDPMTIVHMNAIRTVGISIAELALGFVHNERPDLKLQGDPDA